MNSDDKYNWRELTNSDEHGPMPFLYGLIEGIALGIVVIIGLVVLLFLL